MKRRRRAAEGKKKKKGRRWRRRRERRRVGGVGGCEIEGEKWKYDGEHGFGRWRGKNGEKTGRRKESRKKR